MEMRSDPIYANSILNEKMHPAAEAVLVQLSTLRLEAVRAERIYEKLNRMAMVTVAASQREALDHLQKMIQMNETTADMSRKAAFSLSAKAKWITLGGIAAGFVAALGFGVILTMSIIGSLNRLITGLSEGAELLASASEQVNSSSRLLAEGSSTSRASLEETSSTLEEMSSLTRENTRSTQTAERFMAEVGNIMHEVKDFFAKMNSAMGNIATAGEENSNNFAVS